MGLNQPWVIMKGKETGWKRLMGPTHVRNCLLLRKISVSPGCEMEGRGGWGGSSWPRSNGGGGGLPVGLFGNCCIGMGFIRLIAYRLIA